MYKELVISIIIIVIIIVGDVITQKYTKKVVDEITTKLEVLKKFLEEGSIEKSREQIQQIDEKWENSHDKLACYIEHDELEKVETSFTACKSLAETKNFGLAKEQLDKTIFILKHITDKYKFNIVNIF